MPLDSFPNDSSLQKYKIHFSVLFWADKLLLLLTTDGTYNNNKSLKQFSYAQCFADQPLRNTGGESRIQSGLVT